MSLDSDTSPRGPIVVGVSPSTGSPQALRWAASEARVRNTRLHAVMAWRLPRTQAGPGTSPPAFVPASADELQAEAESRLDAAVRAALGDGHEVQCSAVRGSAAKALLDAGEDAQLLVLDAPRSLAGSSLKPGLLAHQLASKARCPVVTVPPVRPTAAASAGSARRAGAAQHG